MLTRWLRVGVEQAVHVLPDGDLLRIEAVGEDGSGEVGAFATQGDAMFAFDSGSNETLCDAHDAVDVLVVELANA